MKAKSQTLRKKKNRSRKKKHGFLQRMKTTAGRKTILDRMRRGRKKLAV